MRRVRLGEFRWQPFVCGDQPAQGSATVLAYISLARAGVAQSCQFAEETPEATLPVSHPLLPCQRLSADLIATMAGRVTKKIGRTFMAELGEPPRYNLNEPQNFGRIGLSH